jgi:DNA topoisomerase-1
MLKVVMNALEKDKEKIKTSIKNAQREQDTIGKCPKCGKNMVIRTSQKKKRFVGCTGFPECKNTYSLPQNGGIIASGEVCSECNAPVVKIKSKGKRAWELCLNSECNAKKPSKKN